MIMAVTIKKPVIAKILLHLSLRPTGYRARQPVGRRYPTVTVQATRQPGQLEPTASKGLRAQRNGLAKKDNP